MTKNLRSPSSLLGDELADALDRSLQTSIDSLASLRRAVRAYTVHQRKNGVPVETLISDALKVLAQAKDGRGDNTGSDRFRDAELARQLKAWCQADFRDES